ncbi:MAG: hypothetical protein NT062_38655 [Proteobacteria bacterium]|nr:hypothetical protein [Pseudomonadota bacterium]
MEAADILEVYARIKGVARVPVHVQREREKRPTGTVVDLDKKWIGAACAANADCNFPNGFCAQNAYSHGGFCSARCTTYCTDRPGNPSTFCVDDPADPSKGMCVPKVGPTNDACRPYEQLAPALAVARHGNSTVVADVCKPGSHGWVGEHCFADTDCAMGTTCAGATALVAGVCTSKCTTYCSDQPGSPDTFCGAVALLGGTGGSCLRQCSKSSNGSECPGDMTCGSIARNGQPSVVRDVCRPRT